MGKIIYGNFSSWSVISDTIIIKHCDLSVFEHHGTAIDKKTRAFWNAQNLKYPDRISLSLKYNNVNYDAHIEYDKNQRTRLFWDVNLMHLFLQQPHSRGNYPDLKFERIGANEFEVSFLNSRTIENDNQENLESIIETTSNLEGKKTIYYTTKYERNPQNRKNAIRIHGTKCMVCGFDFGETYGDWGKDFIEVHHNKPLYSLSEETEVNPYTDLVCVCSNCHKMIHRKKNAILSIDDLKKMLKKNTVKR